MGLASLALAVYVLFSGPALVLAATRTTMIIIAGLIAMVGAHIFIIRCVREASESENEERERK
jgi:hypothetical protein